MTGDLREAFSLDNLQRAWRWLTTNPEAQFKNYVRHVYRAYSMCLDANIADLRNRLMDGIYTPTYATKLYFPKKSGILRPFSLLSVEDQIVYQAMINIVAERLYPRVERKYYKRVFGNLYAGKRSRKFYRPWKRAYAMFSRAIRKSVAQGYSYTASFDLTAFYDSIDHRVLKHFLLELKLKPDFCNYLCD